MADIGLGLMVVGLIYYFLFLPKKRVLLNPFSLYIIAYFFIVLVQVINAKNMYSQSIVDGLVVSRHQFYYLSYFIFIIYLDTVQKIETFLRLLSIVVVILFFLALVNSSGITLFYHKWAEGHGLRSGITRWFIPGMSIIPLVCIWNFNNFLENEKTLSGSVFYFLISGVALLFRQTRGILISVTLVLVIMLVMKRRIKMLISSLVFVLLIAVIISISVPGGFVSLLFESAYDDISSKQGTWNARVSQIENDINVFMDNPAFGGAGLAIRSAVGDQNKSEVFGLTYGSDLGYTSWLKYYGIVGIFLFVSLLFVFKRYMRYQRYVGSTYKKYIRFAKYHFIAILLMLVTINYLNNNDRVLMLCLTFAVLHVSIKQGLKKNV